MDHHPVKEKNWWSRNWKWVVPSGCLTVILLFVGFFAVIFFGVFGILKSTEVYKTSLAAAQNSAEVQEALGTPVEAGLFMSGSINTNGGSGDADISIPISGPNGKGTVYAIATKSAGTWSYSTLEVQVEGASGRIALEPSP